MKNMFMIAALVAEKSKLDKQIGYLEGHIKHIKNDQKFFVKLNSNWTSDVTFDMDDNPEMGKAVFNFVLDGLTTRVEEIDAILKQAEARFLNKEVGSDGTT